MKTLDKLRKEILSSNTFNILEILGSVINKKHPLDYDGFAKWNRQDEKSFYNFFDEYHECWQKIIKKSNLNLRHPGKLLLRNFSKREERWLKAESEFIYLTNVDDLSYGIAREIAGMIYEGFSKPRQLPTNSRSYECRGSMGGEGGGTKITYSGRKSYYVDLNQDLPVDSESVILESIIMQELSLVTSPLTPKDVKTKNLIGGPWAELTEKAGKYYDKLMKEKVYKYLFPY